MIQEPNILTIDLSALVHNLNQVKKLIRADTEIMGIVKSEAYGHGLLPMARALEGAGVGSLGVAFLYEAVDLRENGIKLPIIILGGIRTREECREAVDKRLTTVIYNLKSAGLLDEESAGKGKKAKIQIKVDTGMGRLGVSYQDVGPFLKKIMRYKNLEPEGLTSHLSSADELNTDFTETQINNFKEAVQKSQELGLNFTRNNLANSAGIMAHKRSHFDMVRPGIMLYGGLPSPEFQSPVPLKPVMSLKGRILQIREFPDQTPISYGRTYYTKGVQKIAVLSAGYGNGLPRSISTMGEVLIRGKRAGIAGRVCMNMTLSDITGFENIMAGDEVIFLGPQGDDGISGDEMAGWSKTISYEIFCSIGNNNIRKYLT